MRKISEMYKESGGTCWRHSCAECNFLKKHGKSLRCTRYPGDAEWKKGYIACKFFMEFVDNSDNQMSIFDLM
mgnify:FL=1